jgi:hypothetical protein
MLRIQHIKWILSTFLMLACLGMFSGNMTFQTAYATSIPVTRTFSSLPYDGSIQEMVDEDTGYLYAWNAASGTISNTSASTELGQTLIGGYFIIMRYFTFFDTSIIPDSANITSATLSLYLYADYSTTDFSVYIYNRISAYPHMPLESGDYYYGHYSGSIYGQISTSGWTVGTYKNITFTSSGFSVINKDSYTKFALFSSRDVQEIEPSGNEYIKVANSEYGSSYSPKLYVSYEVEGYRYIIHGPYYEDGNVANQVVTATFETENQGFEIYTFNGTDGNADTYTIDLEQRGLSLSWNCSSTYLNTTRIINLRQDLTFEELWLYVPNFSTEAAQYYTFSVADMTGINWGYLEALQYVSGQQQIIERRDVKQTYEINFYMIWGRTYTMRLITDRGTHVYGTFTAASNTQVSFFITADMFPTTSTALNVNVTGVRNNTTWISGSYADGQTETLWVQWSVKHKSGQTWIVDDTVNNTGDSQTYNWYDASASQDYVLEVYAMRSSGACNYTFSLPKPVDENPWAALDSLFGDWGPVKGREVIGVIIVLMFLGAGSYASLSIGLVLSWIVAAILVLKGFMSIPFSLLGLSLVIAIFAVISEAKKREREI